MFFANGFLFKKFSDIHDTEACFKTCRWKTSWHIFINRYLFRPNSGLFTLYVVTSKLPQPTHSHILLPSWMPLTKSRDGVTRITVILFYFIVGNTSPNGPLARYLKLRVAYAPGIPGTFSSPPRVSDPDMHHGTCMIHAQWWMPGSLTSGFLWSRWQGKCSRHSRRMRNPQFCISGKRPIVKW